MLLSHYLKDNALSEIANLISSFQNDTLTLEESGILAERINNYMKRKELLNKHDKALTFMTKKELWLTYIGGKQVTAKTKEALEDKIVDYYSEMELTIIKIFDDFLDDRKLRVSKNTWVIDKRWRENYLVGSKLEHIPIKDITYQDTIDFYNHCRDLHQHMTKKYWTNQILAPINAVFRYLQKSGIRHDNPFKLLEIANDQFDEPIKAADEDMVFSLDEKERVMSLAYEMAENRKTINPLGINFLFLSGVRISEICPLRWKDVEDCIDIHRELVVKRDENGKAIGHMILPHCKSKAGKRKLPLSSEMIDVLEKVKEINQIKGFETGPDDFVFVRKYKNEVTCCTERSFFGTLSNLCEKAGMQVKKSPHDIRRTVITNLFNKGMPPKKLQKYAGHSTLQQTMDYVKNMYSDIDEDVEYYEALSIRYKPEHDSNIISFRALLHESPQESSTKRKAQNQHKY